MKFNNKQIKDLERKLGQVEEVIGFPNNKRQLEQVEQIHWLRGEIEDELGKCVLVIDLMGVSVERAINLFEEYLNEES